MVFIPNEPTPREGLFVMQGPLWTETEFPGWYVVLSMSGRLSPVAPDISHCVRLFPPPPHVPAPVGKTFH